MLQKSIKTEWPSIWYQIECDILERSFKDANFDDFSQISNKSNQKCCICCQQKQKTYTSDAGNQLSSSLL